MRLTRAAVLSALALGAAAVAGAAVAGGAFSIPISAFSAGGAESAGGSKRAISSIGATGSSMTGGTLTMTPGVLSAAVAARLNTDEAHAFPTPFKPSSGHTRITFTRLPVRATIRVYTIAGALVRTLEKDDSTDSLVWQPVANDQGSPVASGVYLFVIQHPGFKAKRGKLMVIR